MPGAGDEKTDVSVRGDLMEEAARRWRTDLLKRACGSGGEGWGRGDREDLRELVRDCGRVSERRRLIFDFRCGSDGALEEIDVEVGAGSAAGPFNEVATSVGSSSEIGCSVVATVSGSAVPVSTS